MDAGVDIDVKNGASETALDKAVYRKDKKLSALLAGADTGSELEIAAGGMSLHKAVEEKDYAAIQAIIKLGTDVNEFNGAERLGGMTPLAIACNIWDAEAVKLLLANGADSMLKDGKGKMPISYYFARVTWGGREKRTAADVLAALTNGGFEIDSLIDDRSNTLLNKATVELNEVLIEECLHYGADVNSVNLDGVTPLMNICAADRSQAENMAVLLLERGAEVDVKDAKGNTPLMYAASNRNGAAGTAIAELLFDMGDPKAAEMNNEGKSAADIATDRGNEEFVKLIISKS